MVGILVVSHSLKAAEGICEIAAQMGNADVPIVPVGGGPDGSIGTSVTDISAALDELGDGDTVVILVDLGSAVLNAETALDQFEGEAAIADAPILEGALNATIEATSSKATLESVVSSAEEASELSKV